MTRIVPGRWGFERQGPQVSRIGLLGPTGKRVGCVKTVPLVRSARAANVAASQGFAAASLARLPSTWSAQCCTLRGSLHASPTPNQVM